MLELGLNEKEARVYLAGLQLGQDTAYNIARKAAMKRATVYFVLDRLIEKGFVSTKQSRKAMYYSVATPDKLIKILERKRQSLENILPELEDIVAAQKYRPSVEVYEGEEGVLLVYNETTEYIKKYKEVLFYGSAKHYDSPAMQQGLDLWASNLKNKRSKGREILELGEPVAKKYAARIAKQGNPNHQIRFMPKELRWDQNDNIIYGNKMAIFSPRGKIFAIVIESEPIVNNYRTMFELAWRSTQEI